jgi:uncharacterized protein
LGCGHSGGISRGVDDIITVLTTESSEWQQRPSLRLDNEDAPDWVAVIIIIGAIVLMALLLFGKPLLLAGRPN